MMDQIVPVFMLVLLLSWPAFNLVLALLTAVPSWVPAPTSGPRRNYWIVIPACNEAKVIVNTVNAALAMHSSQAPVRVLVVDDASDDGTAELLNQLDHDRLLVIRRNHPHARQGKGEALNAAFRAIRAQTVADGEVDTTIVGVIDGDGTAPANLIRDVVDAYFSHPEIGGLQCRVRIKNRQRLLGLLQDIEFACVANASQTIRDILDSVGMGGNGQFVRLGHLIRQGDSPWSTCLVDDLELGLRLHLDGVRIRYCPAAVITQQAIVDLRPLLRQRARWAQGNLQCAQYVHRVLGSRQVGSIGLLDYLAYLVAPWLTVPMSILVLAIVLVVIGGLVTGQTLGGLIAAGHTVPQAVAVWIAMVFLPGLIWGLWHRWQLGDEPLWRCLVAGLCYPFFLLIGTLGTWRGLGRHLIGRDEWAKTARLDEPNVATRP
jgi:1,2-diacylglycerol 3-beta-glucosyltransferase